MTCPEREVKIVKIASMHLVHDNLKEDVWGGTQVLMAPPHNPLIVFICSLATLAIVFNSIGVCH